MPDFFKTQITSVQNKFKDGLGAFDSFISRGGNKTQANLSTQDDEPLLYPLELRNNATRPVIRFTCFQRKNSRGGASQHQLFFPCPPNISFSDTANYSTFDLGALGGAFGAAVDAGAKALQDGGGFADAASAAVDNIVGQAKSLQAGQIAGLLSQSVKGIFSDNLALAAGQKTGTITNPNTNTAFTGNGVRQFSFTFKMIAKSKSESEAINKIHQKFRSFSYADSNNSSQNLVLSYPPVWNIDFLMPNGSDNTYIPKIFACYLTSVNSTFNASTSVFHSEGEPLEVDVALTFQETRALTRTDIINLEASQNLDAGRGISDKGIAERQQANPQVINRDTNPGGNS